MFQKNGFDTIGTVEFFRARARARKRARNLGYARCLLFKVGRLVVIYATRPLFLLEPAEEIK